MNIRQHVQGIMCVIYVLTLLGSLCGGQQSEAATYYVDTNGNDSNLGTEEEPFQTLGRGVRHLRPGDTLYVKDGTYAGSQELADIPSGTSWSNPVTIAAYPGHSPVIVAQHNTHTIYFTRNSYIVLDGFIIDGSAASAGQPVKITYESSGLIAHHIRIQNSDVVHSFFDGIYVTPGSDGNEFINLRVYSNGTNDLHHGIYISSSDNVVENCTIYDNAGWGVHVYTGASGANNNVIKNNVIYNNARAGGRGDGIILSSGNGNAAYDNVIWGNALGISADYGASNTYISNNTIYDNTREGIYIGAGSDNTIIKSNTINNNGGLSIRDDGVATQILP